MLIRQSNTSSLLFPPDRSYTYKDSRPIIHQPSILLFIQITSFILKGNVSTVLSLARNPDLLTQRREWGRQVLHLRRKNAAHGQQHWNLWAQSVGLEAAEPSEPLGEQNNTDTMEGKAACREVTAVNIFGSRHSLFLEVASNIGNW